VQELAERLEVAEETVRRWIKSGELPAIDIGRGWRIADTDLERFLKARETAARAKGARQPAPERRRRGKRPSRLAAPCSLP